MCSFTIYYDKGLIKQFEHAEEKHGVVTGRTERVWHQRFFVIIKVTLKDHKPPIEFTRLLLARLRLNHRPQCRE